MSRVEGNCQENCPVIALLEGQAEAYRQSSTYDAMVAEGLGSSVPHAKDVVMEGCSLGGPHHRRFSLAKLACSSEAVADYIERPVYTEAAADAAALALGSNGSLL